jgi:hypothetical protein
MSHNIYFIGLHDGRTGLHITLMEGVKMAIMVVLEGQVSNLREFEGKHYMDIVYMGGSVNIRNVPKDLIPKLKEGQSAKFQLRCESRNIQGKKSPYTVFTPAELVSVSNG